MRQEDKFLKNQNMLKNLLYISLQGIEIHTVGNQSVGELIFVGHPNIIAGAELISIRGLL